MHFIPMYMNFFFLLQVLVCECVVFFVSVYIARNCARFVVKQPYPCCNITGEHSVRICAQMQRTYIRTGSQDLKLLLFVVIVFAIPEVHVFCNIYKHRIFKAAVMRVHHHGGCNRKCERLDGLRTFLPF